MDLSGGFSFPCTLRPGLEGGPKVKKVQDGESMIREDLEVYAQLHGYYLPNVSIYQAKRS